MKESKAMNILIYCNSCYKSEDSTGSKFYIGECMHLLCKNCIEDIDLCKVCKKTSEFRILERDLKSSLTKEPSKFLINTVETSMFQLISSVNLALHYKSQINTYKNLLKRAREELERCKRVQGMRRSPHPEERKTLFQRPERKSDIISSNIDRIYRMGRDTKLMGDITNKGARVARDLIQMSKKKETQSRRNSEFNESVKSYSTNASTRLTMSRRGDWPKKPFKHFGNFY